MIAVIADDFTGAAEIGGIGLKYGLKVVIETQVKWVEGIDLLVIDANTRSLGEEEAYKITEKIVTELLNLEPDYIYKKLDSVLRGNIAVELSAHLKVTGKKRAIMVAGNPGFGRIIENGNYTVNGVALSETSFADDPDFPVKSSDVKQIVESDNIPVYSLAVNDEIPKSGIIVGDVKDQNEMDSWVTRIEKDTVIAGGAGFFDVLLKQHYSELKSDCEECFSLGEVPLFVFGSKFPKGDKLPMGLNEKDTVKINMPNEIYENKNFSKGVIEDWGKRIIKNLEKKLKVIVTVEQDYSNELNISERIRRNVAELIKVVAQGITITDLLIEGGATTSEILKAIGVNKLFPERLVYPGIIRMSTEEYPKMTITTKPGSYPWPKDVVLTNTNNKIIDKI